MITISKKIYCALGLFIGASLQACSPTQLKDTFSIFSHEYEHLSPAHGAMLWESGTVRNYYDISAHIGAPENQWLPKIDGPLRLTHALFTDTHGNFDISQNPNFPARHIGLSTLGNIIALLENDAHLDVATLEDFIIRDPEFAQSILTIKEDYDSTKERFEELTKKPTTLSQKALVPYSKNFALNKLKIQRLYKDRERTEQITKINSRLSEIDLLTGKAKNQAQKERTKLVKQLEALQHAKGDGDYNRVRELAQAIIDTHTPSSFYPDKIAQWILLACLYRKTKTNFVPYYSILSKKIGGHIFCDPIDQTWIQKVYTPADFEYIQQQISRIKEGDPITSSLYETLAVAQMIERYYKGPFPKIAEYDGIVVNGVSFPDCVEVTLMNLCDRILYNKPTGTFELNRRPQEHCAQLLIDFYTDQINKQATNIHLPSVHQKWGAPLQDWPLVTYRQRIATTEDGKPIVLSAPKDTHGFIYGLPPHILASLPHGEDKKDYVQFAGHWYIHVDEPHDYLCEMHPTMRNFIIVLDTLFNLNLFKDKPLTEAFLSEHFNAEYFPKLCANFPLLFNHETWSEAILKSFDRDEYTDQGMRISFEHFDLLLTDEHAEIITTPQGSALADLGPLLLKYSQNAQDGRQKWSMAQLASIFPFNISHITTRNAFPYLLYLPLYNNQIKIHAAAFCIDKMCDPTSPELGADHYAQLAMSCIRHLPERFDWHYHTELIEMLTPEQLQHPVVQGEITRILKTAHDRLNGESSDCEYVPALYRCLIAKDQQLDMAHVTEVIDNILARTDEFDRKPLLNLLLLLTKKGQAISRAHRAVEICIHNSVEAENKIAQQLQDCIDEQKEIL